MQNSPLVATANVATPCGPANCVKPPTLSATAAITVIPGLHTVSVRKAHLWPAQGFGQTQRYLGAPKYHFSIEESSFSVEEPSFIYNAP